MKMIGKLVLGLAALYCLQAQASVEVTSFTVNERDGTAEVMVTLNSAYFFRDGDQEVNYQTVDGTAENENGSGVGDYEETSGTLKFSENGTQSVMVPITQEEVDIEGDEDFQFQVFIVPREIIIDALPEADASATIMIEDDDIEVAVNVDFDDGSMIDVDVTLTCDNGNVNPLPLGELSDTQTTVLGVAVFEVYNYDPLDCTAIQDETLPAGYVETTTDCDPDGVDEADTECDITNGPSTDTIRVQKTYSDGSYLPVTVTIVCESGDVDDTGTPTNSKLTGGDGFASFNIQGFNQPADASGVDTECIITESDVPPAYYQASAIDCTQTLAHQDNAGLCVFTNAPNTTTFEVTKEFTDDDFGGPINPKEVSVTLDCFAGLPITQTQSITQAQGVLFTVESFDAEQLNCEVTEDTDVPELEGYSATYNGGGPHAVNSPSSLLCRFEEVVGGSENTCHIVNDADPVDLVIEKLWVIEGANADYVDQDFQLTLYCDARIIGGSPYCLIGPPGGSGSDASGIRPPLPQGGQYCETYNGYGSEIFDAKVVPRYPSSNCHVIETIYDNAVEKDNGCTDLEVSAGNGDSCLITNTVFFEGIPTLSQYGLAILALLMLGMGMVGFRRFS